LGRPLLDGEKIIRIHGEEIAVAARIRMLDESSGHADQPRLLKWFQSTQPMQHDVFWSLAKITRAQPLLN